jgi:hypothetical protein
MQNKMSGLENFFYYGFCILTLGMPFLWKVIIKKAILETQN